MKKQFFGKQCSLRSQTYMIVFQTCWACRQELAPQFLSCMQNHIHRIWSWRLRVNKSAAAEGQLELVLPNWRGDVRVLVWQHYYYLTHTCISARLFRVALDGAGLNAIRVPDSRLRQHQIASFFFFSSSFSTLHIVLFSSLFVKKTLCYLSSKSIKHIV